MPAPGDSNSLASELEAEIIRLYRLRSSPKRIAARLELELPDVVAALARRVNRQRRRRLPAFGYETRREIVRAYLAGALLRTLAARYGGERRVKAVIHEAGVKRRPGMWHRLPIAAVVHAYEVERRSLSALARRYGVSEGVIETALRKAAVPLRTRTDVYTGRNLRPLMRPQERKDYALFRKNRYRVAEALCAIGRPDLVELIGKTIEEVGNENHAGVSGGRAAAQAAAGPRLS